MEEPGRRSPPELHQNLMSRWDEVVSKMEQVQERQQKDPVSPKASPHGSGTSLMLVSPLPLASIPAAASTSAGSLSEHSPKKDDDWDRASRRGSRASESGSESGEFYIFNVIASALTPIQTIPANGKRSYSHSGGKRTTTSFRWLSS